jgi:CRP-like cAMP-binding protein
MLCKELPKEICRTCPFGLSDLSLYTEKVLRFCTQEWIYQQGDTVTGIYCLCRGQVRLVCWTPQGRRQLLGYLRSGSLLGIEALSGVTQHLYSAQAIEMTFVRLILREELDKVINSSAVRQLLQYLSYSLLEREQSLTRILARPSSERIMLTLEYLSQCNINRVTLDDLAALSGVRKETVCRKLQPLQKRGLILHKYRNLQILDLQSFKSLLQSIR